MFDYQAINKLQAKVRVTFWTVSIFLRHSSVLFEHTEQQGKFILQLSSVHDKVEEAVFE